MPALPGGVAYAQNSETASGCSGYLVAEGGCVHLLDKAVAGARGRSPTSDTLQTFCHIFVASILANHSYQGCERRGGGDQSHDQNDCLFDRKSTVRQPNSC